MVCACRTFVMQNRDEGVTCPACDQFAKVYPWSLYSTAARALVLLYQLGADTDYVASRALKDLGHKGQGDCSRLHKWGLVTEERSRREDGGRSGYWKLTERGVRFAQGRDQVPKRLYVYNNEVIDADGPLITLADALGEPFDYSRLMAGELT